MEYASLAPRICCFYDVRIFDSKNRRFHDFTIRSYFLQKTRLLYDIFISKIYHFKLYTLIVVILKIEILEF